MPGPVHHAEQWKGENLLLKAEHWMQNLATIPRQAGKHLLLHLKLKLKPASLSSPARAKNISTQKKLQLKSLC